MKNICIVTGSRAEYGLLKNVIKKFHESNVFNLILFVTGTHLEKKFGYTYKNIENDNFVINEKIKMDIDDDTPKGILLSMSKEMKNMAEAFNKYKIDLVLILGDRYEMLVVAQIALINNIKIAHLCGGDITLGAYDDNIRNAITKMATYHFVTSKNSYNNILKLNEPKENAFIVGNTGLLDITNFKNTEKNVFFKKININKKKRLILVVNHSETLLSRNDNLKNINTLCNSVINIDNFEETNIIFIKSNADNDNSIIFEKIDNLTRKYDNIYSFISLERNDFLNILYYCDCIIGNSSCGIYEAPLFKKITYNLGSRQKGREHGNTVINLEYNEKIIVENLNNIKKVNNISYPYELLDSGELIYKIIKKKMINNI